MIRLLGFIVGSSLSIGAILVVLGLPEIHTPPAPEPEHTHIDPPRPTPVVEQAALDLVTEPEIEPEPQPVAEAPPPTPNAPAEIMWHAFWSPFGSQIAANGFVSRLESVTGYDYRVVKVETGVYEVAFGYSDESERRAKLSVIASATGLELPDS